MRKAYRCRAHPGPEQAAVLTFGCARKVWNEVLDRRTKRYRVEGAKTSHAESDRYLTTLKKTEELTLLGEVSSVPLRQPRRHQHTASANFLAKRARCPRCRSRDGRATCTRSAFRYRGGELHLAKTPGPLRFIWSWPGMVTVSRNRAKAVRKVAVAHGKVRRARGDSLRRHTTTLVHRYDVIVVEDLPVANMATGGTDMGRTRTPRTRPATKQETQPAREGIPHL